MLLVLMCCGVVVINDVTLVADYVVVDIVYDDIVIPAVVVAGVADVGCVNVCWDCLC